MRKNTAAAEIPGRKVWVCRRRLLRKVSAPPPSKRRPPEKPCTAGARGSNTETGAEPPPTALVQAGGAGAFAGGAGRSAGDHHEAPRSTSERGSLRRWADGSAVVVCAVFVPFN